MHHNRTKIPIRFLFRHFQKRQPFLWISAIYAILCKKPDADSHLGATNKKRKLVFTTEKYKAQRDIPLSE
jgi:hypothetical protein